MRARLLLDTIVEAASGLSRELALPPVEIRPADLVGESGSGAAPGVTERAMSAEDPALLERLVLVPRTHLIVDGYNVSKTGWESQSLEQQRTRLVSGLGSLAARTGVEVTCCFDGSAVSTRVPLAAPKSVRVRFSAPGTIADELIRDLVRAEPQGRPVVVVSSDREVAESVREMGARAVASVALLRLLDRG
jgi:predicted RNA-binding protein with PIN domain